MSLKGGYQIINLKNREFSTTSNNMEYYKDIFFNLLNSHAKMIIVSGLNMDGVKYNDYETIFYEVEQPDDNPYFQCIARRIWNTKDYKCITKYINIYYDDRVMCTQEEFTYEILPDGEMSLTSTNALQNKVITENIQRIDNINNEQDARMLDIESTNAMQDLSIMANANEINRNAVGTAVMPQITLSNENGVYTGTGYVYKYSHGLYFIVIDVDYDELNTFFGTSVKTMEIDGFYNTDVSIIQRSIVSVNGGTKPCEVVKSDDLLTIKDLRGQSIAPPITQDTEIIAILLSSEN